MCQCVNTYKLQEGKEILHPIPVPLKEWNQTGIDLIDPLKETDDYRYIVTAVDYTCEFVDAVSFKEKTGEAVEKFQCKFLYRYSSCGIYITG